MATTTAIIKLDLQIDGGQKLAISVGNLKELKDAIKQINAQKITLDPRSPQFQAASNQLKILQTLYKGLAKDADSAETQIEQANAALNQPPKAIGYYRQLQAQLVALTNQYKDLSQAEQNSKFGQNLAKQIGGISANLKAQDAQLGNFQRNVGNYKQGLLGIGDLVTGGVLTGGILAVAAGAVALGKKVVNINAQVSDSIADVAKAAEVSISFVNDLSDRLETRDTRTSLVDQLGIAEIGGKLGVAKNDLFGFVEAVDVVNVALGDQFGGSVEQTTEVIGKLRNVLLDVKTDNIGTDIVGIGNALNFLEAQGAASAGTIADFAGRIGGVAAPLGVSAGKILGVSATLDELAVNAERGSTAVIRILQRVAVAPNDFAKAIGVPAQEFKDLVNKDIFGSVQLFLEKLNDKKLSNTELQTTLKSLKINGVGVSEVVGKLGSNLGLLSTRIGQSTKALGESGSVTQEFEKKNVTLGAAIEKTSNAFSNLLTNSKIGGGFASLFLGISDFINGIAQASNKLYDLKAATDGAGTSNQILKDSFINLSTEIENDTIATEKNFNILKNGKSTQEQRKQAIDELVKLYPSLLTQQQLEAANIEQLNGLQALSTQVLRAQITERIKLRSKEQITTELVQKKLRQVELEATPDRALLGELTSGETLRNFGILDPIKLRARLKSQFDGDIKEFENALENVDAQFSRLQKSGEDNLSPQEQDALDKFRQFNEGAAAATTISTTATDNDTESKAKNKAENLGAADSIARLTKRVTELQDALSKAPQSGIVSATQKLVLAEQALARAKAKEQEARNPTQNLTEFQQAEAGLISLGVDVNTPKNEADAKAQLDALALELSGSVGVTIPVEVDQEQARKDFEIQKYFLDQEDKIKAANAEKEKSRKEDQQQQNQEFLDIGLQAATQFNNQLAAQETARVDNQLQKQTEAIQTEFDEKRAAAQGNAVIIANLNKQQQAAQVAAEKAAARERKQIALKEAVIAYALAAIKAGANIAGQIQAAAVFALSLAAINAQQFYEGGVAKDVANQQGVVKSANMKPTRHGDNRVAFLKVGERVLTKDNQAAIEQQYGAGIWRNIGAKDPASIFGARHGSMVNPSYGFGRPILNVNTSLSREDIGLLARANAITSERIAESVKVGMSEGAKYNARQEKALSKTR